MNDPEEKMMGFHEAEKAIQRFKDKYAGKIPFGAELGTNDIFFKFIRPYIVSFTENEDEIPMWSMYGDNGNGVVLCFEETYMDDLIFPKSCYYVENEDVLDIFLEKMDKVTGNGDFTAYFNFFLGMMVGLKDPKWKYENEVRAICIDPIKLSWDGKSIPLNSLQKYAIEETCYRIRNGKLIPYKKVYLPKKCLRKVILGPKHFGDFNLQKEVLEEFFSTRFKTKIPIIPSGIKLK